MLGLIDLALLHRKLQYPQKMCGVYLDNQDGSFLNATEKLHNSGLSNRGPLKLQWVDRNEVYRRLLFYILFYISVCFELYLERLTTSKITARTKKQKQTTNIVESMREEICIHKNPTSYPGLLF